VPKRSRYSPLQQLFNIPWRYLIRCDLTREIHENVQRAGFDKVELDVFEADELIRPSSIVFLAWFIKTHTIGVTTK